MLTVPTLAQPLKPFGGHLEIRVEVATGLEDEPFGVWDTATWDNDNWGAADPGWFDLTPYVEYVATHAGAERWGQRFQAGAATIIVDNTSGIFTPETSVPKPWVLPFRPGRHIRIVCIPDGSMKVPLFTGTIVNSDDDLGTGHDVRAVLSCADYMASWAGFNPPMLVTPTGVQSTDARVEAALDRMGWASGARDIQSGEHSVQSSHLAQSTLEECQVAADAEGGAFFASPDGKAVFKARDWLTTDTRSTTIQGYIGYTEVPPSSQAAHLLEVDTNWDLARVFNLIRFARTGSTVVEADDTISQTLYGERSYQRYDFQNTSDTQVQDLADRYLAVHKDLRMRVRSVTVGAVHDPDNDDLNRLLYDTRLGDLLSVKVQTALGWDFEREVQVMGIHYQIHPDDLIVSFTLEDSLTNFLGD